MKKLLFILAGALLLSSCEKNITLDLPASENKVVVEGYVEAGLPPYIILSRTEGYFDPIGQSTLNNLPLRGARVYISNGPDTVLLTEIDTSIDGVSIGGFYVALDSVSLAPTMLGIPGTTYTLRIITPKGESLSAEAKLHHPVGLDSTWFKVQENLDSLGYAWATLSDPDTIGNHYRWFAKRLNEDDFFIPPIGSSFEDKFINGQTFDFAYNRGAIQNSEAEEDQNEEAGLFKRGDTVVVKFCSVDRATFEFWRDAENQLSSNGSPFAVPSNIKSNISGGRGLFATYTATYDTIIAN
ncbi:MAG: DUF4249 domain-containing protein [Bacteroidia bacterium]|nr:DUF4249 domain-containing protein [Bacteroidia bacterium]